MAKKTKKIVIPVYAKKTYLEYNGQFIELGKGNIGTLTILAQMSMPMERRRKIILSLR